MQWGLTAIDMRQIAHSEEWVDAVSDSFLASGLPNARMRLWVVMLRSVSVCESSIWCNILELIEALLPTPITLDPYLDTSKYHFLSTSKVNPQLHHISIVNGKWS